MQPAAKERQREAVIESNKARGVDPVSADLRFMEQPAPAEHRKSTTAYITPESTCARDGKSELEFRFENRSANKKPP